MDQFHHRDGQLWCEDVPLDALAREVGTPAYVYSTRTVVDHIAGIRQAFGDLDPLICFAAKANGNLALLRVLRAAGAGFDIVSEGELHRVLAAGADPQRIVFSGVGKTVEEVHAGLEAGLLMFNVESEEELDLIEHVAKRIGKCGDVAIRVNPDVDPKTHRYISTGQKETKFGVDIDRAGRFAERIAGSAHLRLVGIQCHIGSQISSVAPYQAAVRRTAQLATDLRRDIPDITWLNMGGGYGIYYRDENVPKLSDYADAVGEDVRASGLRLIMEPGRVIVGNAGVLLTEVLFNKVSGDRRFVIVDAGMNDLIRPSLYEGYHRIWPVTGSAPPPLGEEADEPPCDIVGPVCETGDFFAQDRPLPQVTSGDVLAIMSVGAYAFVMSSNYNERRRPPEILVDGDTFAVVRVRETFEDLVRCERPEAPYRTLGVEKSK